MKLRTVKKAIKAIRDGRTTPLLKKVRLDDVAYFENNKDHEKVHH